MDLIQTDVLAAQAGDVKAFERLINTSKNAVSSIALSIVKDVDASEDVAQRVYINCWQNLKSLSNPSSFLPWVRQIPRHLSFNYLRDNKVAQSVKGDEADDILNAFCLSQEETEQAVSDKQVKYIVSQLIDELPSDSREVVLLYYREQQSSKHVAELLDVSEASVRKKLSRAREMLKVITLEKFGRVLLSTAPAVSFTSITLSMALSSPSAVAAGVAGASSTTVSSTASKGLLHSVWTKVGWLLSGAMIASLIGMFAVVLSHKMAEKQLSFEDDKKKLVIVRNYSLMWIFVWGILFAASYEFTDGFVWPLITYSLFAVGLTVLIKRSQMIITAGSIRSVLEPNEKSLYKNSHKDKDLALLAIRRNQKFGFFGTYSGLIIGFAGLITGLISSGRLVL